MTTPTNASSTSQGATREPDALKILDRIIQSQETKSEALKAKQRRLLQSLKDGTFAKRAQDLGESIRRTANGGHWAERTC
jgi:hypothetical protein